MQWREMPLQGNQDINNASGNVIWGLNTAQGWAQFSELLFTALQGAAIGQSQAFFASLYKVVHLVEDKLLLALKYELRFSKGGLQETVDELLILCQQTVFLYQMYHAGQGEHEA